MLRPCHRVVLFVLGCVLLTNVPTANAIPRYSARYQQDCHLCHTNPTGGGQRTLYASQFLTPTELAANFLDFEDLESINPQIGDNLLVGADVRTLFAGNDGEVRGVQNFFQMQADIYLAFTLNERYTLYFDRGSGDTYEVFGMGHILPWNGYFKVGRFTPAYGWKIADHTAASREHLGLFPPGHTDTGLELGFYPGNSAIHVAVTNGAMGQRIDENSGVAGIGRIAHRQTFGPLRLALGTNLWFNDQGDGSTSLTSGVFGYAGFGPLVYTGEYHGRRNEPDGLRDFYEKITSHELAYRVWQGVDVLATYSFYEPDVDLKTGVERRFGVGVEALVHHFFQLRAMFNTHDNDVGAVISQDDFSEVELQAHFLY